MDKRDLPPGAEIQVIRASVRWPRWICPQEPRGSDEEKRKYIIALLEAALELVNENELSDLEQWYVFSTSKAFQKYVCNASRCGARTTTIHTPLTLVEWWYLLRLYSNTLRNPLVLFLLPRYFSAAPDICEFNSMCLTRHSTRMIFVYAWPIMVSSL